MNLNLIAVLIANLFIAPAALAQSDFKWEGNVVIGGIITDDRQGTAEMMAPLFGLPPEELGIYPHACIGTVEQIADDLRARRDRWDASYIVFQGDTMEPMAPVVAALRDT